MYVRGFKLDGYKPTPVWWSFSHDFSIQYYSMLSNFKTIENMLYKTQVCNKRLNFCDQQQQLFF